MKGPDRSRYIGFQLNYGTIFFVGDNPDVVGRELDSTLVVLYIFLVYI